MGGVDSVYFLMFPGWNGEMRSNRWHYASRWAAHCPVTLVQTVPSLGQFESYSVVEPRFGNCRILYVRAMDWGRSAFENGLIQAEQIRSDIGARGFRRVLFWMYDPSYLVTWVMLPALVRVLHATENYFMYPDELFGSASGRASLVRRWKYCMGHADAVICCSDGVAESCRPHVRGGRVETITNGCDREFYAGAGPDRAIATLRGTLDRIAVFAGNIDERVDYVALAKAAEWNPEVLFLLVGPKNVDRPEFSRAFDRFVARPNAHYLDRVPVERLPGIYSACDVGMLPYARIPLLYENGFPLKTFEMVAAGLPIVVQNLRLIEPFAGEGIVYVPDGEGFSAGIGATSRATLGDSARDRLAALASMQDYSGKFDTARDMVERIARLAVPTAPMRELFYADPICFREPVVRPDPQRTTRSVEPSTEPVGTSAHPVRRFMRWIVLSLPRRMRRWGRKRAPDWLLRFIEN